MGTRNLHKQERDIVIWAWYSEANAEEIGIEEITQALFSPAVHCDICIDRLW